MRRQQSSLSRFRHDCPFLYVANSFSSADSYLKDDLVLLLEEHLNNNETTFAKHPDFREYYSRGGSPVKRERSSPDALTTVKTTRRRTLVKAPS